MKARVKATGEIIEVKECTQLIFKDGSIGLGFRTDNREILNDYQLDFKDVAQEKSDVKEKSFPKDEPDYWEKLKHQAAIAAMQGLMSKEILDTSDSLSSHAIYYATTLVEKLKNEKR